MVEVGRGLVELEQPILLLAAAELVRGGVLVADLVADAVSDALDRLGEAEPLHLHDEVEQSAAGLAAMAEVDLLGGVHVEGRVLLLVERARPAELPARLLQRDVLGDHLHYVRALAHGLYV